MCKEKEDFINSTQSPSSGVMNLKEGLYKIGQSVPLSSDFEM